MSDYYYFVNYNSEFGLGVREASKRPGAGLIQWPRKDAGESENQLWRFDPALNAGIEYGPIYNKESSLLVSVPESGAGSGATQLVQEKQSGSVGSPNQLWRFVPVGLVDAFHNAVFVLLNKQTGLVADVEQASLAQSARVIQHKAHPHIVESDLGGGEIWSFNAGDPTNQFWSARIGGSD